MDEQFLNAHDQYADAIFRFCYLRVGNREQAYDLTQETFTKTWEYLANGGVVTHLRAFLYRTARNSIIDAARKQKESSLEHMHESCYEPPALGNLVEDAATRELIERLRHLDPTDRELLILRFIEGYSPQDIAQMFGTNANVVSVRCFRAKRKARKLLSL